MADDNPIPDFPVDDNNDPIYPDTMPFYGLYEQFYMYFTADYETAGSEQYTVMEFDWTDPTDIIQTVTGMSVGSDNTYGEYECELIEDELILEEDRLVLSALCDVDDLVNFYGPDEPRCAITWDVLTGDEYPLFNDTNWEDTLVNML